MYKMKKMLIAALAVLMILLVPAIMLNMQRGIMLSDVSLIRKDEFTYAAAGDNSIHMSPSESGMDFAICLDGVERSAQLTWDDENVRIEYADGEVAEGVWNGQYILGENGKPLWFDESVHGRYAGRNQTIAEVDLNDVLCRLSLGESDPMGEMWLIVVGALFYIAGALNIFWPEGMFFMLSRWKYEKPEELFDSGRKAQIFGGAVGMLGGLLLLFAPLLLR